MDTPTTDIYNQLTSTLHKILEVVGHTPDEIEKHKKTFFQTIVVLSLQKTLSSLSKEKQEEIEGKYKNLGTGDATQVQSFIDEVLAASSKEAFQKNIAEATEVLMAQYILSVQEKLTEEKKTQIQSILNGMAK